jgi:Alpha amylase, catalytic domain
MSKWSRYPTLYEINTWVWLSELQSKYGKTVELGSVPPAEWDAIAALGFDAIWLMGVWERSPAGIAIANRNRQLLGDFRRALPNFLPEDNIGSPYCVRRYMADPHLGGPEGLAHARSEVVKRDMRLILDFVPNHVAPDHPWASDHPEYFVRGGADDLKTDPSSYVEVLGNVFARGRDPYFPAWPDVLQLNAFNPSLRRAAVETLSDIARQCDGVRCDMAMLLMNSVFERTWGARVGQWPSTDYWREVIPSIKALHPDFLFIAEAYWDLEWELQQQGFDFCYDKRLYDRLEHGNARSVRLHLSADLAFQAKLLRFLENHDEPRAAAAFAPEREEAAAVVTATLPGARLFHEGQFEGRRVRLPVFLRRRPEEPVNQSLQVFYEKLLKSIDRPTFREGEWSLCECVGWPDNASCQNLLAWTWRQEGELYLIAINLNDQAVQARVAVAWPELGSGQCVLTDAFSGARYEREGDELVRSGLYVELRPWGYHFLFCRRQHTASCA